MLSTFNKHKRQLKAKIKASYKFGISWWTYKQRKARYHLYEKVSLKNEHKK